MRPQDLTQHDDEESALPWIGEPASQAAGPQGDALILELQRLRQALTKGIRARRGLDSLLVTGCVHLRTARIRPVPGGPASRSESGKARSVGPSTPVSSNSD